MAQSWNALDPEKRVLSPAAMVLLIEQLSLRLVLPEVVQLHERGGAFATAAQEALCRRAINERELWKVRRERAHIVLFVSLVSI